MNVGRGPCYSTPMRQTQGKLVSFYSHSPPVNIIVSPLQGQEMRLKRAKSLAQDHNASSQWRHPDSSSGLLESEVQNHSTPSHITFPKSLAIKCQWHPSVLSRGKKCTHKRVLSVHSQIYQHQRCLCFGLTLLDLFLLPSLDDHRIGLGKQLPRAHLVSPPQGDPRTSVPRRIPPQAYLLRPPQQPH